MLYTVHISCSNEFEQKRAKILGSANGLRSVLLQNPNLSEIVPIHTTIEKQYNQILNFGKEIEKIKGVKSVSRNVGYFEGKAEPSYTLTCTQEALLPLCDYATKHQQISFIINKPKSYTKNVILGENTGGRFFRIIFIENSFKNVSLSEYYHIEKAFADKYADDGFSIYLDHNYTNGIANFIVYLIPQENESQAEIIERIDTTEQSLRVLKNSLRQTIDIRSISESRRGSVESWYVGGKKQKQNQYDYKTQKEELKNYFSGLGTLGRAYIPKILKTESQVIQFLKKELDGLGFLGSIFLDNNKDDFEAHKEFVLDAIKWIKETIFVTNLELEKYFDTKKLTLEEYYQVLYNAKDKDKIYIYNRHETTISDSLEYNVENTKFPKVVYSNAKKNINVLVDIEKEDVRVTKKDLKVTIKTDFEGKKSAFSFPLLDTPEQQKHGKNSNLIVVFLAPMANSNTTTIKK